MCETDVENFREAMMHIMKAGKEIEKVYKDLEQDKESVKNHLDDILAMLDDFPD